MTTPNPIQLPLRVLFSRLNILNGLLTVLDVRLTEIRKVIEKRVQAKTGEMPAILAGCSLPVLDLTSPETKWYPSGGFYAADEGYVVAIDDLLYMYSAVVVSQGYEAFETFLFEIAAAYLHTKPGKADTEVKRKFELKGKNGGAKTSDLAYWQQYVRCYRGDNNDKIFSLLRVLAPGICQCENSNPHGVDLVAWYDMVSEVRHAATHKDFLVKRASISDWSKEKMEGFSGVFSIGPEIAGEGYKLRIKVKQAEKALSMYGSYAFVIFKFLSIQDGYSWDLFNEQI